MEEDLIDFAQGGEVEKDDEEILSELMGMCSVLTLEDLIHVALRLDIQVPNEKRGNRTFVLRLVLRYLNSEELESNPVKASKIFKNLHNSISRLLNPNVRTQETFCATYVLKPSNQPNEIASKINQHNPFTTFATSTPFPNHHSPNFNLTKKEHLTFEDDIPKPVLKIRDFKISGSIGTPGQKDRLTYLSLSYQINSADKQGFSETEIISGVIKAINPGNPLRTYLEGRTFLSVKQLLKILRSHGKEKVILISQEEDCPFEESMVMNRFLHTIFTGLRK